LAIRLITLLSFCLLNTGCGFQPLYQHADSLDHSRVPNLAIAVIPDRTGQIVRNRLLQQLAPHIDKNANVIVEVTPIEIVTNSTSVRRDGTASRYRLTAHATIYLKDAASKKVLFENSATAINAYSIGEYSATAAYSTLTAAQDAKDKALQELSEQIVAIVVSHYQNSNAAL